MDLGGKSNIHPHSLAPQIVKDWRRCHASTSKALMLYIPDKYFLETNILVTYLLLDNFDMSIIKWKCAAPSVSLLMISQYKSGIVTNLVMELAYK